MHGGRWVNKCARFKPRFQSPHRHCRVDPSTRTPGTPHSSGCCSGSLPRIGLEWCNRRLEAAAINPMYTLHVTDIQCPRRVEREGLAPRISTAQRSTAIDRVFGRGGDWGAAVWIVISRPHWAFHWICGIDGRMACRFQCSLTTTVAVRGGDAPRSRAYYQRPK